MPEAPPGEWHQVPAVPQAHEAELVRGEELAPGRSDGSDGIAGFCPPRADLFLLRGGRIVVVRDPCAGPMAIAIRERGVERPVSGVTAFGAGMARRALPLGDSRVLLVIEPGIRFGLPTMLWLIDLRAARADFLDLPRELATGYGLEVAIAGDRVFLSGGVTVVPGAGPGLECHDVPAGQGCDPSAPKAEQPNRLVFAVRPR